MPVLSPTFIEFAVQVQRVVIHGIYERSSGPSRYETRNAMKVFGCTNYQLQTGQSMKVYEGLSAKPKFVQGVKASRRFPSR